MLRATLRRAPACRRLLSTAADAARPTTAAMTEVLAQQQREAAARAVPWFVEQMPDTYFRQVGEHAQARHLRTIAAIFQDSQLQVPELSLVEDRWHGAEHTFFAKPTADPLDGKVMTRLEQQLASLPEDAVLRRVLVYTSKDQALSLNVFETTSEGSEEALFTGVGAEEEAMRERLRTYSKQLSAGEYIDQPHHPPPSTLLSEAEIDRVLARCSHGYVASSLPRLLYRQLLLYQQVAGGEDAAVLFEHNLNGVADETLVTLAIGNSRPRAALQHTLALLGMHGLQVGRAFVDQVADPQPEGVAGLPSRGVTLLRAVVRPDTRSCDWAQLEADLSRFKWLDDSTMRLAAAQPRLGLARAEVVSGLADLSLSLLDHPLLSRNHVRALLTKPNMAEHAAALGDLFLKRFDPAAPLPPGAFDAACEAWERGVETASLDEESKELMRTMMRGLRHTVRTNAHLPGRHALVLRLQGEFFEPVLPPSSMNNTPFGVFFGAGRHFNGYHVRFRDVARGGLRVVLPATAEAHTAESRRHFNECFSLAWAQQLKNKDIPEGGSKAVCLVTPTPGMPRERLLHGCVKAFTDGLLDMITPAALEACAPKQPQLVPPTAPPAVAAAATAADAAAAILEGGPAAALPTADAAAADAAPATTTPAAKQPNELLYLGPDENITPTDINWVVERAAVRGYAMPSAFMSSKPDAGINHKEYGVTSEGVAVFLHEALLSMGIEPTRQPWSVKLTGGPDGDVGGNMLKILDREYGPMVRVVGIADGSGCAEDPQGLPMAELLRLFNEGLPLGEMRREALGPQGVFHSADTAEGAKLRNSLHNRVQADVFVPAGGRPSTVNGANWRDFLLPDGTPSSKVIVEGANLFVTAEARQHLFDHCALPIIKDSSANKCGVICSSMEIVAGMLLSDKEFIALKPRYVDDVLATLRKLARAEAQLLFAEARRQPDVSMPKLSEAISQAILRVTDATAAQLDTFGPEQQERLWPLTREHLPPSLFDAYSPRISSGLPWEYTKNMLACSLASRLVYREGLAWVAGVPDSALSELSLRYLQQEQRVRELAEQVGASGIDNGEYVKALLLQGGVRAAVERGR